MDDLSPGARSLLQAADTFDDPSAEDAARVKRAVMMRVGAIGVTAAVVTAGSTQAKAASVMSIAAKLTAALAVTAGGVAATWSYVNHSQQQPPAASAPAPAKTHQAAPQPLAPAPAEQEPAVVSPEEVKLEEAPVVKGPRVARAARPEPEKAEAKPQQSAADLEAEMKLIRGADAALRAGRSSDAMSLLAQHQAEHPHASLAHEREGLRAIAQCQVGAAGATSVAERFIARSPRSPLAPRLKSACKIKE